MLAISLTVFSANLHPTEAPNINRQKLIEASGSLYDATSVICNSPLAKRVPDNRAAGILILSFSPGGIYEVAVIAMAYDLEPDFVAFHHIIRLLMILFTVPIILKLIKKN